MAQEAPRPPLRALIIDSGPTRAETSQLLAEAGFQVRGAAACKAFPPAGRPCCPAHVLP